MKARLKVIFGPDAGKEFAVAGTEQSTIGRGHDCQCQLTDPSVSRTHASLKHQDGHFVLTDLGSATGVVLNGGKTDESKVRHGDRFVLGKTEILIELLGDPEDETYDSSRRA
jgi:pSer/pThr/pTyr-binding forkhead associated (FHA) protein